MVSDDERDFKMGEATRDVRKQRPGLHIGSAAIAADWLRLAMGAGPLAGIFGRSGVLIFCPLEGEHGYVPPADKADHDGPAKVRTLSAAELSALIAFRFACYKEKLDDAGEGDDAAPDGKAKRRREAAVFPMPAVRLVLGAGTEDLPNLRTLKAVTHTPIVRNDGSILDQPGYDPATGYLYLPTGDLYVAPVPEFPSPGQVAAAVALLLGMLDGFRFASDHDRANMIGALITPLIRELAPPAYKLVLISAPQPGSGKSLLAMLMRILHGGVFRAEVPDDEAEIRKAISTILEASTAPVVTFDNATGVLRSATLAGLLTSARWDDRLLGTNTQISRANDRLWTVTGNNLALGGDLVRRSLWVTIDPGAPHPELRTDFAIADLPGWVREHRGDLLHALLVLVRHWVFQGQPWELTRGDSYGRWVGVVRGILACAGIPGVFDHQESARQSLGDEDEEWATFLRAVHDLRGETPWLVRDLLATVEGCGGVPLGRAGALKLEDLPVLVAEKIERGGGRASLGARSLGMWLKNRDGRWAGGLCVREVKTDAAASANAKAWRIESQLS